MDSGKRAIALNDERRRVSLHANVHVGNPQIDRTGNDLRRWAPSTEGGSEMVRVRRRRIARAPGKYRQEKQELNRASVKNVALRSEGRLD